MKPDLLDTRELIDQHLIPSSVRSAMMHSPTHMEPLYCVNAPDYDRLPIDTFLVLTSGTCPTEPQRLVRIVKPNRPSEYPSIARTAQDRLLFCCWRVGMAVRSLEEPTRTVYRHIVLPDDPRHDAVAAFKVACDTLRSWQGRSTKYSGDLLCRALGVTPST